MKIRSVFPEIVAKLWKHAVSCNVEEFFRKLIDADPGVDHDFPNIFLVKKYIFEDAISSFRTKLLTDRPTDKNSSAAGAHSKASKIIGLISHSVHSTAVSIQVSAYNCTNHIHLLDF